MEEKGGRGRGVGGGVEERVVCVSKGGDEGARRAKRGVGGGGVARGGEGGVVFCYKQGAG